MHNQYNWNRRWIQLGTRADKSTDLSAFSLRWFSGMYPSPTKGFTLDELAEIPVVILLGEPGIGKSSEIASYFERASSANDQFIWKLQKYPPKDFNRFFDQSQLQKWRDGRENLIVFLDSFDEGVHEPVTVGRALAEALEDAPGPLNRLFLRIACRTADWSEDTTTRLKEIFGEDYVFTVELDALGQQEVIAAATIHQVDPYQFLEQIEQNALATLTLKPITLIDLLKEYSAKNGVLPDTRNLLYENMCRRLCEEHNPYHGESERHLKFTVDELFIEAARLATIMLTTRCLTVWMPASTKDIADDSIAINELHSGSSAEDRITRAALNTGFFASRGTHQLGWAHLSYAEFLAAFYMHQKMSLPQIKSLLIHSDGQRIVPQLREVAAWIASMNQAFFDFVVDLDPETLFQSDLIMEDIDARATLTSTYLGLFHREILIEIPFGSQTRYRRFNHPGLSEQLSEFAYDSSRHYLARYVAIDIIRVCSLHDAANNLVDLALDPNLDKPLRRHAARVVAYLGDSTAKLALKPLIFGDIEDTDDELKGTALSAMWPEHLSTQELFAVLTPRKQENFIGEYVSFLRVEIIDHISPNELPVALKWAANIIEQYTDAHHHIQSSLQDLIDEIVYKSWIHLEIPGVSSAFAQVILQKILNFQPLFGTERRNILNGPYVEAWNEFLHNAEKRHRVLFDVIELVSDMDFNFLRLINSVPLVINADLGWLLELLQTEKTLIKHDNLLRLIEMIFRPSNHVHMDVMAMAIEQNKALQDSFYKWFYVLVDSEYADERRKIYQRDKEREAEWQRINEEQSLQRIDPPPLIRLNEVLERCEQGEIKEWWRTNIWLSANEYGHPSDWHDDLRQMPNWDKLEDDTRERLISTGIDYVYNVDSEATAWFGQQRGWRPAFAAHRMLLLLHELGFELPKQVWQNWMPAIVTFPSYFIRTGHERHWQFVAAAYQNDGEGLCFYLREFLKHLNSPTSDVSSIENYLLRFNHCFDDQLAHILINYLDDPSIKPFHYSGILRFLLKNQNKEAASRALTEVQKLYHQYRERLVVNITLFNLIITDKLLKLTISRLIYGATKARDEAIHFASLILAYAVNDDLWQSLWLMMQADEDFGCRIIENTADIYDDMRIAEIGSRISEKDIADLFLWITERYPYEEDPELTGWVWVSPRHNVSDWRNSLLEQLAARGTFEALNELERITLSYPDLYRLKRLRKLLIEQIYVKTWHPPQVTDVQSMLKSREQRFVQTANQLLDAIVESLDRLQKRLQGLTPSAIDLWNEVPSEGICRPKDENTLSDYVKRHLDTDLVERGIIVNREVEIRPRVGKVGAAPGEVPDLHITSFSHSDTSKLHPLVVLIEVKGNWHDDLMTAAQTQLVDRYLQDNDKAACGLYLVGWFNCKQWDEMDYRREKAKKHEFVSLSIALKSQAAALSNSVLDIRAYVLNASLREERL